jgi:hypothetical protein
MENSISARILGGVKALFQKISRFVGSEKPEESHEIAGTHFITPENGVLDADKALSLGYEMARREDRPDQGEVHESPSQPGEPEKVDAFRPIFGSETVQSPSDNETSARKTAKRKVTSNKSVEKKKTSVKKKATKKAATKKSVKKKLSMKEKAAKKKTAKKKAPAKKTVKKKTVKKKAVKKKTVKKKTSKKKSR